MKLQNAGYFARLLEQVALGKTIQCQSYSGEWWDVRADIEVAFTGDPNTWRVKPEPKLRPWKPVEVPVGALLKYGSTIAVISFVNTEGFGFTQYIPGVGNNSDTRVWGFHRVFNTIEHSPDHGKT